MITKVLITIAVLVSSIFFIISCNKEETKEVQAQTSLSENNLSNIIIDEKN